MEIPKIEDYQMTIKYDGPLKIAIGRSRMEKSWKNQTYAWARLLRRLAEPLKTAETHAEYMKMSKDDQDRIKDIGGFIGGALKGGRRKADSVTERQLVALDADFAPAEWAEDIEAGLGIKGVDYAYAVYSTHKHSPEKPRLRVLIPLDRPVTPDEYEAIARKLADRIGIDYFDDTTYQPSRLMYWPSVSRDGDFLFDYYDLPWVCADSILAEYPDWTDTSYWPESSRANEERRKLAKKQGDPTEKTGLIGAFCRTYTVEEAITEFLPDVYTKCSMPGRYTYTEGSTAAGLVIYQDGKFAYSNHATDPISGKLCNAFDLVRLHCFGALDDEAKPGTATTKLPSYKAMMELVQSDESTKLTVVDEKQQEAIADFTQEDDWKKKLEIGKTGVVNSLRNARLILENDEGLKSIVFNQMADNLEIKGEGLPWQHPGGFWREADDAQLENYLDSRYTEFSKARIMSAVTKVADDRSYHPIREYLQGLPEWDKVKRIDTLLIDYLDAEDSEYVRAVTRKTLCAAIKRVLSPGCKFDTVLVLCGPQGIGKSTLIAKLGGPWFSDSLNLADTRDKTAAEKLQGYWIIEIGEMAGIGSAGVKTLRSFITTQDDRYRASYGRRVSSHPRQCILIGTTNAEEGYLNDVEGGRRFWPVKTPAIGRKKVWDITRDEVNQIWAEAYKYAVEGESLILSGSVAEEAQAQQKEAMISDPREEMIVNYLDTLLPADWYERDLDKRRDFLYGSERPIPEATLRRDFVCSQEIWCECFGNSLKNMEPSNTYAIKKIMSKLCGWEASGTRKYLGADYGRQRGYVRKYGTTPRTPPGTTPGQQDNLVKM